MGDRGNRIQEIIADLYDGVLHEAAWHRALTSIAQLVGGQGPYLATFVPTTGAVLHDALHGYDADVVRQFREHWATKDIRVSAGQSVPLERLVTGAMLLPKGLWERSEICNEFLHDEDMGWFLACWVHKSSSRITCLSVQATHERGRFGHDDIDALQLLVSHVRRSLDIKEQLQVRQVRADAIKEALQRAPFGVVVLDADGYVLDITQAAQAVLETARLLKRESGRRFLFADPLACQLRELRMSGMKTGHVVDGVLHARRPNGQQPITLIITPAGQSTELWLGEQPRWFVFVFDPLRPVRLSIETLRHDLCLTRREAEVVALLTNGQSLAQTARSLKISAETARGHLKAVFTKTGCHSQAEIVRRIALGPAAQGA
jgi:DNA-binding CsgD family transcriptional regulator